MSARSKSRKRAIDLLYGADVRGIPVAELVAEQDERAAREGSRAASWAYAREIVLGVEAHRQEIDAAIAANARGWTLARMPVVDRAIARVAAWEILFNDDVPDPVAISEAVEAANLLSTEESAGFLNGLLAAIVRSKAEPAG